MKKKTHTQQQHLIRLGYIENEELGRKWLTLYSERNLMRRGIGGLENGKSW